MARKLGLIAASLVLLVAFGGQASAESDRSTMIELHLGTYTPEVDKQFSGATPFADAFKDNSLFLIDLFFDFQIWHGFGTLAVGGGVGYGWADGVSLDTNGADSNDETGFNFLPVDVSLTYRFDWPAVEFGIPIVPYGKAGITYAFWIFTDGKNDVSEGQGPDGKNRKAFGGTAGWHAGGGVQLLLDFFDRDMATEFDGEAGVNNTYLFAEFLYRNINDFGSGSSIELSDSAFSFGLMFEI